MAKQRTKKVGERDPVTAFDHFRAKTQKLSSEKQSAILEITKDLIERSKDDVWLIKGPCLATIGKFEADKTHVQYKTVTLVGSEKFRFIDAYIGKRNGVIVRMAPFDCVVSGLENETDLFAEVGLRGDVPFKRQGDDKDFRDWLKEQVEGIDIDSWVQTREEQKATQERARIEAVEKERQAVYGNNWGVW